MERLNTDIPRAGANFTHGPANGAAQQPFPAAGSHSTPPRQPPATLLTVKRTVTITEDVFVEAPGGRGFQMRYQKRTVNTTRSMTTDPQSDIPYEPPVSEGTPGGHEASSEPVNQHDVPSMGSTQSDVAEPYRGLASDWKQALAAPEKINASDTQGWTPLTAVAHNGDLEGLKELLAHPETSLKTKHLDGRRVLECAAGQGHFESVGLILDHYDSQAGVLAHGNHRNQDALAAAIAAIHADKPGILAMICERGTTFRDDLPGKSFFHNTLLDEAKKANRPRIELFLKGQGGTSVSSNRRKRPSEGVF